MTNTESLKKVFLALGGDPAMVPEDATNGDLIELISQVAEPGGGGGISIDDIASGHLYGSYEITTEEIRQHAFMEYAAGEEPLDITSSTVLRIAPEAFKKCGSLRNVEFTACTQLGTAGAASSNASCFEGSGVVSARFPALTAANARDFAECANLTDVYVPRLASGGQYMFYRCTSLRVLHVPAYRDIPANICYGCSALKVFALNHGWSDTGPAALATGALQGTPIADGNGYVLVPRDLVSRYETYTNWSALKAAGAQFLAVEDYTVDGTVTGDLDAEKIAPLLES